MGKKSNAYSLRAFAIVVAWLTAAIFFYWISFPVLNSRMANEGPKGIPVGYYGNTITWWLIFLMIPFGLLPIILMWSILVPQSMLRADFHLLFTILVGFVLVIVCAIGYLVIALFYCNSTISTTSIPCNDARFCCVYTDSVNDCPQPAVPCSPLVSVGELDVSWEWKQHGYFSLAFFLIAIVLHWPLNANLRDSGYANVIGTREAGVFAGLLLLLMIAPVIWLVGFIFPNLQFIHGYPLFAIPVSPGPFVSYLYGFQWWMTFSPIFNTVVLVLLAMTLLYTTTTMFSRIHMGVATATVILNIALLVYYGIVIFLFTNNAVFNSSGSVSNDPQFCCNFFGDPNCPNVGPCSDPTPRPLQTDNIFTQLVACTGAFLATSVFHVIANIRFKVYGLIY